MIQRFGDDRIIVQLPGASGSITRVQFRQPVSHQQLLAALEPLGLKVVKVEEEGNRSFTIESETLRSRREPTPHFVVDLV